jgi:hypothetical protein
MEVKEGLEGPQNSGKAEKVAPVSMRREIGLPSMRAVTLGSQELWLLGLGVLGSISHQPQSLVLKDQLGRRDSGGA